MTFEKKYYRFQTYSRFLVIILTGVVTLHGSCKKAGLFQQAGEEIVETRAVAPYTEIVLSDKIDLVLKQDTIESITVRAGKNLVAGIRTSIENGQLIIKDLNKYRWSRNLDEKITVTITGNQLQKITYNGAGSIRSENRWRANLFEIDSQYGTGSISLDIDVFNFYVTIREANADITVTGHSIYTRCYVADHGSVNLEKLSTLSMQVDYRSIRKSSINTVVRLDIKIQQTGDVYYTGNPEIYLFRNNKGNLIKAG